MNEVGSSSLTMIVDSRKKCSDLVLTREMRTIRSQMSNYNLPRIDNLGAPIGLGL